ncbi:MAG: histidine--tRNA ligase [Candidatus Comchoanobacterales bacterium]
MTEITFQPIRGFPDVLGIHANKHLEMLQLMQTFFLSYGYDYAVLPLVEKTNLFTRGVGQETDIVTKEMYTFNDRHGDSIALRPEGTASMLRALLQSDYRDGQIARYQYYGPMFRHERPQKGRLRQFHQLGIECYGVNHFHADTSLMTMCCQLWKKLGFAPNDIELTISYLGSKDSKNHYLGALNDFLSPHLATFSASIQERFKKNPLRILDTKDPVVQSILKDAPLPIDYLSEDESHEFNCICSTLNDCGIKFTIDPKLVRGLDYYNGLVFEFKHADLGAQSTLCAGGRYDGLATQLGSSKPVSACGFSIGIERLLLVLPEQQQSILPVVYGISLTDHAFPELNRVLADIKMRTSIPIIQDVKGGSLKNQLKRATKHHASFAIIVGEEELQTNQYIIKNLHSGEQMTINQQDITSYFIRSTNETSA